MDFIKIKDYAVININNMIPVPKGQLTELNINAEKDSHYKFLLQAESREINRQKNQIRKNAEIVYNHKKLQLSIVATILLLAIIAIGLCYNRGKKYNIRITIPAGSTESFIYSDEEISPKGNTIMLYAGEGMGDGEIVLKPIEVKEENAYDEPTYITPGMPVKMDVEKGAWFKVGVNMQNFSGEDIVVYITVSNVDIRIE